MNLVSGGPEAHFWLCHLLIFVDSCWYVVIVIDICWYFVTLVYINWYLLICVDICCFLTTFINIWLCLRKQSHWYICSSRIAYMINLVSGGPEAHLWLRYLLIFVCICWYLLIVIDICWYVLISCVFYILWCLRRQSRWYICSLRIAYMINLVSGGPEAHFWLCYLLIFVAICWYVLISVCISWSLLIFVDIATRQKLLIVDGAWGSKAIDIFAACA